MAGRKARIDRAELARLVAEGWTVRRIAEHFGVSESGVLQAKRSAGLARPMLDHGAAIPWTVRREHVQSGPATNLRNLSAVAQGGAVPAEKVNTALRWARRLIDAGADVTYDPERGFTEIPASREGSHIAVVLDRALAVLDASGQTGPSR
ncbi:helix-turn-helix domain-containing protein [Spongiactinospora sp. TRM90649]|uniref:helix-turn-helix domain-containing protein n=1 Tax=Spongiactinospora sp. TRM90649 TaxID=3031114 RepID=UPI0023F73866|nr:helix-turn-helix domain-containing protein [Spongiactinospora sp. TRM90649]MDF5755856.1 helix-turn-helix domain containing protein [Spongiactinospora sp. TRM90649]